MGLTGFPGRSFPDALLGAAPLARDAIERFGVLTRRALVVRAGDFFFLNVLKRVSRVGDAGLSPFVFCACTVEPHATKTVTSANA